MRALMVSQLVPDPLPPIPTLGTGKHYGLRWPSDASPEPSIIVEDWQLPSHKACGWIVVREATEAEVAALARAYAGIQRACDAMGTTE